MVMAIPTQDMSTREEIGMLAVMDALADREQVTQRELSRQTGLHLKKVNYCLHKLVEKGHLKFQRALDNPDKRVYLYILTPAGLKEKSRLTYRFLKFTMGYYARVEEKLTECLADIGAAGVRRLVLLGASDAARIVIGLVGGNGISVVGVLDDQHNEEELAGVRVIRPAQLAELEWDGVLITALGDLDGVDDLVTAMGLPAQMVWRLS